LSEELEFVQAAPAQQKVADELMHKAFAGYVQRVAPHRTTGPYFWLSDAIRLGNVYLGRRAGKMVAVVAVDWRDDELVIDQIGVEQSAQGAGVGSWMMDNLERVARENGATKITLHTAEIMDDLLRFYIRHGFVETHRALPHHGGDENLRVHMAKQLS
jgi:ribosomal protein S18 acetylase RimI-like enzyme